MLHQSKSNKSGQKRLSGGQRISLSPQEERMLKIAFDYLSGFHKRSLMENTIEKQKEKVAELLAAVPQVGLRNVTQRNLDVLIAKTEGSENEKLDEFNEARAELAIMEEKLKLFVAMEQKISFKDLDSVLKRLGYPLHRRNIEHMIWEVDENSDGEIDWDEFQLTYYRNITDETGSEPCNFFELLEFVTFDEQHKGYVMEDDCMEILFARHGSMKLEQELQLLFGQNLRAAGGDGTLSFEKYSKSVLQRTGRRALVF